MRYFTLHKHTVVEIIELLFFKNWHALLSVLSRIEQYTGLWIIHVMILMPVHVLSGAFQTESFCKD